MEVAEQRNHGDQALFDAAGRCARGNSLLRPAPLRYAIARHGDNGLQLLHVPLRFGEEALILFSSRETARRYYLARRYFLSRIFGAEWYTRTCSAGELVSLLLGPYEGLKWVLLDPQPGARITAESAQASLMSRERFLNQLL